MFSTERAISKPEYTVSFTPYEAIVANCHLRSTLENLPKNAVILEVGSGLHQEFAEGIKKHYPDYTVISLDPSLSISKLDPTYKLQDTGSYVTFNTHQGIPVHKLQSERLNNIKGDLAIAANAFVSLPFENDCIDLLVDNKGPGLYLVNIELQKYLKDVYRVLKCGGKAHISSFLRISNATTDPVNWKEKSSLELKKLFENVVPDINMKVFYNEYDAGVIISKVRTS